MKLRRALLWSVLAALVASACSPDRAFTPRLPAAGAPASTSRAGGAAGRTPSLSSEQGFAVVAQGYSILLDQYVDRVDPTALLAAAWDGFTAALPASQARPARPELTGANALADLNRFRRAYLDASALAGPQVQESLAHAAVRRMAEFLGDCHTSFADPQQMQEQADRLNGDVRFGGVGIRIKRRPNSNEPIVVWELLNGGSAGKAGIKPGDAIVKVDGRDATTMSLEQLASEIRGPEGSTVKLTVERSDGKRVQDFSLKRVQIADPAFQSKWLNEGVLYLRLYSFSQAGQAELLQALRDNESKNPKGWILDLRTNAGGDQQVLLSLLSKFLKDGPFGFQVDRRGQRTALGPDGSYLGRQHPLVVLVSDSTSSAAEIFAASVQQYKRGTVLGTRTAGCLGIGNRFQLDDGSGLTVTVAKLLGPGGEEFNKVGVTPGETVEVTRGDLASGRDPQMQRALAILGAAGK